MTFEPPIMAIPVTKPRNDIQPLLERYWKQLEENVLLQSAVILASKHRTKEPNDV